MNPKEYYYRLVRPEKTDLVFSCTHSSIGAACAEIMKRERIQGAHRWANGYTVYMVDGARIVGILVRD